MILLQQVIHIVSPAVAPCFVSLAHVLGIQLLLQVVRMRFSKQTQSVSFESGRIGASLLLDRSAKVRGGELMCLFAFSQRVIDLLDGHLLPDSFCSFVACYQKTYRRDTSQ